MTAFSSEEGMPPPSFLRQLSRVVNASLLTMLLSYKGSPLILIKNWLCWRHTQELPTL